MGCDERGVSSNAAGLSSFVCSVSFSPEDSKTVSGSSDRNRRGEVELWDVASGECLQTWEGHSNGVTTVPFSPDSSKIMSGSSDYTVKIWNMASGECQWTL